MTDRQKQHLLGYLGYYAAPVDGIWGRKSQAALEKFRQEQGLEEAEVWNRETQEALLDAVTEDARREDASQGEFWEEIEFFDRAEFECTCGGRGCGGYPAEPVERLVRNAEKARRYFGRPATVSSGVRCQLRNSELPGSAANSLHLSGRAMDFSVAGISAQRLLDYIRQLPQVHEAYAIDSSYVHMGVEKY